LPGAEKGNHGISREQSAQSCGMAMTFDHALKLP
jgi:hypothetical protein